MHSDRRRYERTGSVHDALDAVFNAIRQQEVATNEELWQELGEKSWRRFVREIDDEPTTITLNDGDFLRSLGVACNFPWGISSPNDLMDRGTPLKPREDCQHDNS